MAATGDKLGPYELLASIGKGGMGEVFRARDTRLNRQVAIKCSAERFTERFEREARAIASLNHPLICHLYDVGPNYLVMELVEGPTLAERLKAGGIPLEESLSIARQIADALEAAHERGIVHRDLKPGNVKLKTDGTIKVLDFGLAKMGGTPTAHADESPTFTMDQTEAGMIVGTAAYMSPEQARGKPVDQRADIYAFGAVVYEMVTGARLHNGETSTEILASVIKDEPHWVKVPPRLQRLLRRCLEKDPQKRLRHIGDVMSLVDDMPVVAPPPEAVVRPRRWMWIAGATAALTVIAAVAWWAPWRRESGPSIRFDVQPSASMTFITGGFPVVSPNGKWVVFPATGADGVTRQWLRSLDSVEVRPLAGTESANPLPPPVFWSPDSRFIAFSSTSGPASPGQLKKIDISGGPPLTICDITQPVVGGTWNRDDMLVFAVNQSRGLFRVPASGGMASPVTLVDSSRGEFAHRLPNFLPDGRHFLYLRVAANQQTAVFVGSIDAKPEEQSLQPVLRTNRQAVYVDSPAGGSGRLLFLRDTTLFAQAFDPRRLELSGEPVPVTDQVGSFAPATAGLFSVSPAVLAYRVGAGGNYVQLTWVDREGKTIGTVGERGTYVRPAISPDGARVAAAQWDRQIGNSNIWVLDLARGTSTKVTFNNGRNDFAVWSPDGKSVAFASNREGHLDIYQKNADGTGEETLLWKSADDKEPTSWSADGRFLLCTVTDQKTQQDIWVLPLQGDRKPIRILGTDRVEGQAMFSPDVRWIVYSSDESGGAEIYVRPFSPEKGADATSGGKWLISKGGGMFPLWRGKEIFYTTITFQQTAVEVDGDKVLQPGVPRSLFSVGLLTRNDVSADGQRFLHIMLEPLNAPSPYIVVTNWQAALKK